LNRPAMMEAVRVSFSYNEGIQALEEVDFSVQEGEFTAVLASNGSGKTTLIKVLVGLLRPQKGIVRVDGRDIRRWPRNEICRKVGLVFQSPADQLFAATVEEDVAYGPRNLGLGENEVRRRVLESLDLVNASRLRERAVHRLSFGEQKRVCMAGVLAMRPAVLILDEPTAGLDPAGETAMMCLLNKLNREQGITVVLATHSVDLLPLFAERIYVLHRGRVLGEGPVEQIFSDMGLIDAACLRLPYVAELLHLMKHRDGVPIRGLPLTIGEARKRLLELIPEDVLLKHWRAERK